MSRPDHEVPRIVIVGGGVAALEGALALREHISGADITLLAPNREFTYRPMRVVEPFARAAAHSYPIEELTRQIGVEHRLDSFAWLDAGARLVHTQGGEALDYDALLLATGARPRARFRHVLTLDDRILDEQLNGLIQDIEGGYVKSLAFVVPSRMPWPLPVYEIALMTARRADDMNIELPIVIATPEDAPLAVFGPTVSDEVGRLLDSSGIVTITSAQCEVREPGRVTVHGRDLEIRAERILALPELYGPSLPGVPRSAQHGFVSVDPHGRVRGCEDVFAAGDAIDFPVKQGGLAALQADAAAESIAALTGAPITPRPVVPVIHGVLLGGDRPLYLRARVTGGHGSASEISDTPLWAPATKIHATYLAPLLERYDHAQAR